VNDILAEAAHGRLSHSIISTFQRLKLIESMCWIALGTKVSLHCVCLLVA